MDASLLLIVQLTVFFVSILLFYVAWKYHHKALEFYDVNEKDRYENIAHVYWKTGMMILVIGISVSTYIFFIVR